MRRVEAAPVTPPPHTQVKESKRQFIFDVVNEGGESEKMELFVSFCEDTIFEMQIAAQISEPEGEPEEDEDESAAETGAEGAEEGEAGPEGAAAGPAAAGAAARAAAALARALRGLSYRSLRRRVRRLRRLTAREAAAAAGALLWAAVTHAGAAGAGAAAGALRLLWGSLFGGGLVEGAKKVTVTELLAGMPDPTGDEVHGEQPAGPGGDADGEDEGEGAGDAAEGAGDEEAAAHEAGPGGADRAVAVADGGPFRSEGAPGGLGDMGDTAVAEPPTPEGSPIIKRKLGVRVQVGIWGFARDWGQDGEEGRYTLTGMHREKKGESLRGTHSRGQRHSEIDSEMETQREALGCFWGRQRKRSWSHRTSNPNSELDGKQDQELQRSELGSGTLGKARFWGIRSPTWPRPLQLPPSPWCNECPGVHLSR